MAQLFTNNAAGTLSVALTSVGTSAVLGTGQGALFPVLTGVDTFVASLVGISGGQETSWEVMQVTARTADTLTIVRAQEGTTAAAWAIGTPFALRLTAATAQKAAAAQPTLVSGTNIRTVNGNTLLGSTDITIASGVIPPQLLIALGVI